MTPPLAERDTVAMGVLLDQEGVIPGRDELMDVVLVAVPKGKGVGVHLWLERAFFEGPGARAERREIEGLIAAAAGATPDSKKHSSQTPNEEAA